MLSLRQNKAFSLVELLLTALILAYSLSVILSTYNNSLTLNNASRNVTIATSHAQYIMESIRNTSFTSIATNIASGTWNWNAMTIATQGLAALNNESIVVTSTGTNPLTISVTINWRDLHGRVRAKVLKTVISG
jgi:type II secretory pathway pseudopilin PulG